MRIRTRLMLAVTLPLLTASAGHGQTLADYDYENLTFRGIGADWGWIWPNRVESTSITGLRLDLGFLGPAVRIVPGLSYWSSRFRTSELDRLAARLSELPPLRDQGVVITAADLGRVDWSDFTMSLDAHVVWTAPLDIITFVGVGGALHALNGRGDIIDDTFIEDLLDSTAAGGAFMAGLEFEPVDRLRLYAEARYNFASDIRYGGIRVGGAFMLPPRSSAISGPQGGR